MSLIRYTFFPHARQYSYKSAISLLAMHKSISISFSNCIISAIFVSVRLVFLICLYISLIVALEPHLAAACALIPAISQSNFNSALTFSPNNLNTSSGEKIFLIINVSNISNETASALSILSFNSLYELFQYPFRS